MAEHVSTAFGRGGRDGEVWSESGSFQLETAMPTGARRGATPEERIGAAWAACSGTTLAAVNRRRRIDVSGAVIQADVTLDADIQDSLYAITKVGLTVSLPADSDPDAIDALMAEVHPAFPVSKVLVSGVADARVSWGLIASKNESRESTPPFAPDSV